MTIKLIRLLPQKTVFILVHVCIGALPVWLDMPAGMLIIIFLLPVITIIGSPAGLYKGLV